MEFLYMQKSVNQDAITKVIFGRILNLVTFVNDIYSIKDWSDHIEILLMKYNMADFVKKKKLSFLSCC